MKLPVITTILLVLAAPAHARLRHDRVCDIAQEKSDAMLINPQSGTAIMFGPCTGTRDNPLVERASYGGFVGTLKCGYQAYREGKQLSANPYKNRELAGDWIAGWKMARKSCTTGRPPTLDADDIQ